MTSHSGEPPRTLTQQDLRYLVCPVCHAGLRLEADGIDCTACGRRYAIVNGLPVLLVARNL